MESKEVKVRVEYEWTFTKRQWDSSKKHLQTVMEEVGTNVEYDPINSFYILRDLCYPKVIKTDVSRIR